MGEPCHFDTGFLQQVGDVMGGGLTVDGCVQGEDDLCYALIMRARHQRIDGQVLRADAVQRRQCRAEYSAQRSATSATTTMID